MGTRVIFWCSVLFLVVGTCFSRLTTSPEDSIEEAEKDLRMTLKNFDAKRVLHQMRLGRTSTSTCTLCKVGINMLQDYVEKGKTTEEIAKQFLYLFNMLNLFPAHVWEGIVDGFKDQLVYVIKNSKLSTDVMCAMLLGSSSCGSASSPIHNWTLHLPDIPKPPVEKVEPPKEGSPVMKVLQLTDVHYDPYYLKGANAKCKEPLCCRKMSGPPEKPEDVAGRWGDYNSCDTPYETLDNILNHISQNHKVDYIMWTGDIAPHDIWNGTRHEILHLMEATTNMIRNYFPDTPVYPSVGNHECVPVNSFPPLDSGSQFSPSWLYNEMVKVWKIWLPEEVAPSIKQGGFYSVKVKDGLRIIAVNSNYCNSFNYWLFINSTDPEQHLQWLIQELLKAEMNNEKVHIISHIPPGKDDCLRSWSETFTKIINRFENTVKGQFYGHTHQDDFEVFYDSDNRPTNVAYIAPSVTTFGGVNPAFRIYTVDGNYPGSSFAVLDHESYYMNLTAANAGGPVKWVKAYSAKDEYSMASLQPEEWNKLIGRFEDDDSLFQKFYRYFYMLSDYDHGPCAGDCKARMTCALRTSQSNDPSWCSRFSRSRSANE